MDELGVCCGWNVLSVVWVWCVYMWFWVGMEGGGETPGIRESVAHTTPPRSLACAGDSLIPSASRGRVNGGETPLQPETQRGRPLV